jgi:hypothetical protein
MDVILMEDEGASITTFFVGFEEASPSLLRFAMVDFVVSDPKIWVILS